MYMLDGIQAHIDAVAVGEPVEQRIAQIVSSNFLSEDARRTQLFFLKSFCWAAALEPLCGQDVVLSKELTLRLNRSRMQIEGRELPGVRVDSDGWLVIEGRLFRAGKPLRDTDDKGNPLWPIMMRNVPARGPGPWENFRPQVLLHLDYAGRAWPRET